VENLGNNLLRTIGQYDPICEGTTEAEIGSPSSLLIGLRKLEAKQSLRGQKTLMPVPESLLRQNQHGTDSELQNNFS
jgi:hypothetical protein